MSAIDLIYLLYNLNSHLVWNSTKLYFSFAIVYVHGHGHRIVCVFLESEFLCFLFYRNKTKIFSLFILALDLHLVDIGRTTPSPSSPGGDQINKNLKNNTRDNIIRREKSLKNKKNPPQVFIGKNTFILKKSQLAG